MVYKRETYEEDYEYQVYCEWGYVRSINTWIVCAPNLIFIALMVWKHYGHVS